MSQYLITGGQGFIGGKITHMTKGVSYDLKSGEDILDVELLMKELKDEKGVFHCAAKISVPESILKPEEYYKNNVVGTQSVIEAAEANKLKIVFSSSAAVYGETTSAVTEESELSPLSPYAENKIDGEKLLQKSSIPHVALRYFNVYGPGQSKEYAGIIATFIMSALRNEDLIIYGDGNQVRDFVFVDDVAQANMRAMEYHNESFEVFNIGTGIETSLNELAQKILELTQSKSIIVYKPFRSGDIVYSNADVSKAEKILDWKAKVSLEEGLEKTIYYYKGMVQ
jgi:UDP-glucose 4-epimerase